MINKKKNHNIKKILLAAGESKRFGDKKTLKKLVKLAHDKNIKVLLDFVSNHVHESFSTFKIGSSVCKCASPTSPFLNVDDKIIVKSLLH